jgi:hypothetical protein
VLFDTKFSLIRFQDSLTCSSPPVRMNTHVTSTAGSKERKILGLFSIYIFCNPYPSYGCCSLITFSLELLYCTANTVGLVDYVWVGQIWHFAFKHLPSFYLQVPIARNRNITGTSKAVQSKGFSIGSTIAASYSIPYENIEDLAGIRAAGYISQ